ncbi:MAG: CHAT domain-containing protein [Thiotrichales bacterium]
MAEPTEASIALKLNGERLRHPTPPRVLQSGTRGMPDAEQHFLPDGLVSLRAAYGLVLTRTTAPELIEAVAPAQVLALELDDGVTIFVRADKLRDDLRELDPTLGDALELDALRDRGATSRGLLGDVVRRLFVLDLGHDEILRRAREKAIDWARAKLGDATSEAIEQAAALGVSWLGTRALMWAIESQLAREPGLYRWVGARGTASDLLPVDAAALKRAAEQGPLLIFIHGTGSSTVGSFGDLLAESRAARDDWRRLTARFGERVFAYEHRTLSESPIENALALARALPERARINLVTHSRGGLVGDLLSLGTLSAREIETYRRDDPALADADAEQQQQLHELAAILRDKQFTIERYVRVACPARGTRLASANFDAFLGGLLSLIGLVPLLAGQPIYAAFKRVVLEIARNRTHPSRIPGIEAMLPEAPLGSLLLKAPTQPGMQLAVIAGDIEGGGILKRLGVFFTDLILFDRLNNDLVVDTDSMFAGLARPDTARWRFEQGADVSHFRYFANEASRAALRHWLTADDPAQIAEFRTLSGPVSELIPGTRGAPAALDPEKPVVVVLPGIMGSHLSRRGGRDRVWLDPDDLIVGGFGKLRWVDGADAVAADAVLQRYYGDLATHLEATHNVVRAPYDWRQPLDVLGDHLAARIGVLLDTTPHPIRLLAHSMGGLVTRAMIARHPATWARLIERNGARFIMLGTPNLGSYKMVETLIGKASMVRNLARLDLRHDLQEVLDLIGAFPGALQLLPCPGSRVAAERNAYDPAFWRDTLKPRLRDVWFGNRVCATPSEAALNAGRWLWQQPGAELESLPEAQRRRILYVCGQADVTPCGISDAGGRIKMLGTSRGDGAVTWDSGLIPGIGSVYYAPVKHGDLCATAAHFPAITELLLEGATDALPTAPAVVRDSGQVFVYDAGPTPPPTAAEFIDDLLDASPPQCLEARPTQQLEVSCAAMDLRYVSQPLLVGHYEGDVIAGAEALIDRDLVGGELSRRQHLGLYAGPLGSTTVVLQPPNAQELQRGACRGAIVAGLGEYGKLTGQTLTEAVQAATLRYLLQLVEGMRTSATEVRLATLLIGFNSTANLTIEGAVGAIVQGVLEANRRFGEVMPRPIRVSRLEFVELYLDTAITITHAIHRIAARYRGDGATVTPVRGLLRCDGVRERLRMEDVPSYWPRLIVTNADADAPAVPGTALAQRLRFVYLGQRARAETVFHQRQPDLVETLVAQSVTRQNFNPELARTLFQLVVPYDFKEAARQLSQMLLVVDGYSANLPWELMMADALPLSIQTAMVRQLSTQRFRHHVRLATGQIAYVVGNPSTAGFARRFADPARPQPRDPDPLPGAEAEAYTVAELLRGENYRVLEAIGDDQQAQDVINKLYQHPYRILHIAAHGIFEARLPDGSLRSGVVLSDGLLLTAAEIGAMETVPEVAFLNCCHLGQVDRGAIAFNRLAYSVARELIEIGVRAVVVAGWAVHDQAANLFAETFYTRLIRENRPFGEAVFDARRATFEHYPHSNTWGAYQAYGEPGYRIDPARPARSASASEPERLVAVEELLDRVELQRNEIARRDTLLTSEQAQLIADQVARLLDDCPRLWRTQARIETALGQLYADLGSHWLERACDHYRNAIRSRDSDAVPIKVIEQLANLEARLGASQQRADLIEIALKRLLGLNQLSGADDASPPNAERCALLGSAYKRLASLRARQALDNDADPEATKAFETALAQSAFWYQQADGTTGPAPFDPNCALNRLALQAVLEVVDAKLRQTLIDIARQCASTAQAAYRDNPNYWNAVMPADALVVEYLLDERLATTDDAARKACATLIDAYDQTRTGVHARPREVDSTVTQLCLIALFFRVKAQAASTAKGRRGALRNAACLERVANHLVPGHCANPTGADEPESSDPEAPTEPADPKADAKRGGSKRKR